jgi:hypothetical protein
VRQGLPAPLLLVLAERLARMAQLRRNWPLALGAVLLGWILLSVVPRLSTAGPVAAACDPRPPINVTVVPTAVDRQVRITITVGTNASTPTNHLVSIQLNSGSSGITDVPWERTGSQPPIYRPAAGTQQYSFLLTPDPTGNTATLFLTLADTCGMQPWFGGGGPDAFSPALALAKTHTGNFTRGQSGAQYTLTASNTGRAATSGTVTVTDTVPNGLTPTAASGTGWSCPPPFPNNIVTCTRSDALAMGAAYPPITLSVNVAADAPGSVTNTANVSGGSALLTPNSTVSDPTTIVGPPAITSANATTFTVGQAGTFTVTTTGLPTPAITRGGVALPNGVTFVDNGNGTGTLSGTPAAGTAGSYNLTFTAANGVVPNATQNFTLTVNPPPGQAPAITSANATTFTVGQAGTFTVTTTGLPTPAITRGGVALPNGVTFVDNGNGTGTLSGTPAAGTAGTYNITFTAANGIAPNATQNFALTVSGPAGQAPAITSANATTFAVGVAGTFTVTTTGSPTPAITRGGVALPAGMTFVDNGNGTGTLSGTPAAGTAGSYNITFTAANGVAPNATQNFTLTVSGPAGQAPAITSANATTFAVGVAGTFTVTTTGSPTPSITRGGVALPAGVTFVDNGNGTGTLAGTPAAGTAGTYNLTFTAANGVPPNATQNFTLTVSGPAGQAPAITSANATTFTVGQAGTFTVTTTGLPTPAITRGGVALPSGVVFVDNGNGTGTLSGTPAAGTAGTYNISFTAANGVPPNATQNFTLTVNSPAPQPPGITSANNTAFAVGQAGTFTVTTTGFPTPTITRGGVALPGGVTFVDNGNGTGTLSGTPDPGTGGSYAISFTAANGVAPDASQNFTLVVNQAPAITSANNTAFAVGQAGTFTVTTTGFPAAAITRGGVALPSGVTFVDNGNGTGTLSGTPDPGTAGIYAISFTAANGVGSNAVQNFTLSVNQGPAITSANATTFAVGQAGTFTVTTTGFPTPTITRGGVALPGGVTFVDNGNGTGTLSGTPDPGTAGVYAISFTASNGVGLNVVQNFTLTVSQGPAITSANATTFTVGQAGTFTVTTTGSPTPTITRGGVALPAGVTFVDNGNGTGTLSGTPDPGTAGVYAITFTASNGVGSNAVQNFTLTVSQAPAITSANATSFTVGTAGTFTVTTTGFPTPTITRSGVALPSGVTFVDNGNGTGTLSGTPDPGTGGTYAITFTAANGVGLNAVQNFTLTVNQAPAITSANATTFTVGTAGSFTVTTTGSPAPTITRGGVALPSGVTFGDNGNGTGTLSGTPDPGTGGTYAITFTAANGVGSNAVQSFTLTVNQAPAITSANATTFTIGVAGTFTVTTTGFPTPTITRGGVALPSGVTFVDNGNGTGTLSGTPDPGTGGSYAITFTAANGVGSNAVQNFTLTVSQPPAITSANTTTFTVAQAGTFTVTTTGSPTPTITRGGVALPSGVTFVDNGNGTGTLGGTPDPGTTGSYAITFTASNGVGSNAVQNFTLNVHQAPGITSANSATFNFAPNTFSVTTTGFPTPSITRGGDALPSGVSFVDNTNGTGTLSGTPGPGTAGTYNLTFTAANGVNPNAVQPFTLSVVCPTISVAPATGALPQATFGAAYSQNFTPSGGATPYSFGVTAGALPAGLNLAANGPGTLGTLSGSPTTTGNFSFTITATDANLCSGSTAYTLAVAPNAVNDSYSAVGNTQLVGGSPSGVPTTPHTTDPDTVLANDGGPALGTTTTVVPATNAATTQGGAITLDAGGNFVYTPPVDFTGDDTYTYTLTSNGVTDTATITFTVANTVWYVDNTYAGANGTSNGASHRPFTTLTAADAPSAAGDYIYVHQGSGNTTGAITLKANQTLWGQGSTFTLGTLTIAATGDPTIANAGTIVTLPSNGGTITIAGMTLSPSAGSAIAGTTLGTTAATVSNVTVNAASAGAAVSLSGGSGTISFDGSSPISQTGSGRVVDIQGRTGGTTFSGTVTGGASSAGVHIGDTTISNGGVTFTTLNLGTSGARMGSQAVTIGAAGTGGTGTYSLGTVSIFTNSAAGIVATNVDGTINSTTGTVNASGGTAIDIDGPGGLTTLGMTLSDVTSTGGTNNVNLSNVGGSLTMNGGALSGATGTAFAIGTGTASSGGTASVSYAGTITKTSGAGQVVNIQNKTSGTVAFSGAICSTATPCTGPVSLTTNTGATINFTGGVNLSTGSSNAFTATGGGTVSATQNNTSIVNTLATTTGTALNVANTTIGASGLTFRSISAGTGASGPANGIVLNATGSSGGLSVQGDGGGSNNGSGGTIQNTTAEGVLLSNVGNVSLNYINITNPGTDGIRGTMLNNGLTVNRVNIDDSSGTAPADKAIDIGDFVTGTPVSGTVNITNSLIGPSGGSSPHDSLAIGINSGTSTWNITGTTFRRTGNSGINAEVRGSSNVALNVSSSTFAGANVAGGTGSPSARGIFVNNLDDSVVNTTIQTSTFTNNNIHIDLNQQNDTDPNGSHTFHVLNNTTMTGARSHAMNIFAATGGGGIFTGTVQGNTIGNSGVVNSGSEIGNGIRVNINGNADATMLMDTNTIRQTPNGRGIEIIARNGTGGLDVTVTNNDVNPQAPSNPLAAILVQSNCLTICNTVRSNVRDNTVPAGTDVTDLLNTYLELVETSSSTLELVDTTAPISGTCASELAATNTGSTGVLGGCALIAGPINTPP